jgi:para-nitrobenzyl esterase
MDYRWPVSSDYVWPVCVITEVQKRWYKMQPQWMRRLRDCLRAQVEAKLKAMYAAELAFVFDNVDKSSRWVGENSAGLQRLADAVSAAWAEFSRTGNPNHAGLRTGQLTTQIDAPR